jgi:cell division protein FtsB
MKKYFFLLCMITFALIVTGCTTENGSGENGNTDMAALQAELESEQAANEALQAEINALEEQLQELELQQQSAANSLLATAVAVVELIDDADFDAVADYVHPNDGVRFSPYGYVDEDNHIVLSANDLSGIMQSNQEYTWGAFDGTGDPIDKTFAEYYDRFIYDQEFASPELIGYNTIIGTGNTLINLDDVYPDAEFVEFHFSGFDPQYDGMDWRSLRLVFEENDGDWLLVGVVHDEWTI